MPRSNPGTMRRVQQAEGRNGEQGTTVRCGMAIRCARKVTKEGASSKRLRRSLATRLPAYHRFQQDQRGRLREL